MFTDLSERTDKTAILFLTQNGIMDGYADGSFRPNNMVTVAELCKIICYCLFEHERDIVEEFSKIDLSMRKPFDHHWGRVYLTVCYQMGFLQDEDVKNLDADVPSQMGEAMLSRLRKYWFEKYQFGGIISYSPTKISFSKYLTRNEIAEELYALISGIARFLDEKIFAWRVNEKFDEAIHLISEMTDVFIARLTLNRDLLLICWCIKHSTPNNLIYYLRIANVLLRRIVREDKLYHYTSLHSLQGLTKGGSEVVFKASNSVYLNDPSEGKLLMQQLSTKRGRIFRPLQEKLKLTKSQFGDAIVYSDTYILSFSKENKTSIEQLPMWVHYGDGGKGCLIELDTIDCNLPFYRVMYQEREIQQVWRELKDALQYVVEDFKETDNSYKELYSYAYSILEQLSCICKLPCYSYEQEVRMLLFEVPERACEEEFVRDGEALPRIYVPCPEKLSIERVILGPKVVHPERYALTINHRDIDEVYVSQLPFQ